MRSGKWPLLLALLLVGITGCGDGNSELKADKKAESSLDIIRGHYLFAHEVRALRPCGEDEDVWVIDRTGQLAKLYGKLTGSPGDDRRVSVIATGRTGPPPAEGFGSGYRGSVTIEEVVYAASEGFGCDFDLAEFVYRASGNEPFWMVEVSPDAMTLRRPGSPEVTWQEITQEHRGNLIVLHAAGGENPATLTLEPGPGFDSMSGAFFHLTARFEMDGTRYSGAALRGEAVPDEEYAD